MSRKENNKLNNTAIWETIDFKKVKHRLNRITHQIEGVLPESSQIKATDWLNPEDYAKLRQFMKANQLTEAQAIAMIVHTFFSDAQQSSSNIPSSPDEILKRIAALEQQMAELRKS
ncbi:MAG TPA: hypothetical protein V6D11_11740 [Waterburya sp.]|jgi:hypothetical protein